MTQPSNYADDLRAALFALSEAEAALSASNARAEAAEERIARLTAVRPAPYKVDEPDSVLRLVREVHGYLSTCRGKCGSDTDGRAYAIDALSAIADALVARTTLASMKGEG